MNNHDRKEERELKPHTPQPPQQQLQLQEDSDDESYCSDDSLDYCINKAYLYPDAMTSKEIAKISRPVFNHIRNHPEKDCGCPYKSASFK